jgi:hypothetical protein
MFAEDQIAAGAAANSPNRTNFLAPATMDAAPEYLESRQTCAGLPLHECAARKPERAWRYHFEGEELGPACQAKSRRRFGRLRPRRVLSRPGRLRTGVCAAKGTLAELGDRVRPVTTPDFAPKLGTSTRICYPRRRDDIATKRSAG